MNPQQVKELREKLEGKTITNVFGGDSNLFIVAADLTKNKDKDGSVMLLKIVGSVDKPVRFEIS